MVFLPETPEAYLEMAQAFLSAEKIDVPLEYRRNARRFLYYQLFRSSLSFENYLQDVRRKGYVQLAPFSWQDLLPENSPTVQVLVDGIAGESLERQARLRSKEGTGETPLFLTEDEA
jgi:hypothetical protein